MVASLQDIVNSPGSVIASEQPFYYLTTGGATRFSSRNSIVLEKQAFGSSGYIYFQVKADYEIDVLLQTKDRGYFDGLGRNNVPEEFLQAYDIEVNRQFNVGTYGQSMKVTLRGDALLAWDLSGAKLNDPWGDGAFEEQVELRGIGEPGLYSNGLLLSLTHPFGNYESLATQSLTFNNPQRESELTILQVRKVENTAKTSSGDAVNIDFANYEGTVELIGSGFTVDGAEYKVELVSTDNGKYQVLVNGTVKREYMDESLARNAALEFLAEEEEQAKITKDDRPEEIIERPGLTLGIGLLAIIGIVIAGIGIYAFARGAGQGTAQGLTGAKQ